MSDAPGPDFPLARTDLHRLLRLSRDVHLAAGPARPQRLAAGLADVFAAAAGVYVRSAGDPATLATADGPDGRRPGVVPDLAADGPEQDVLPSTVASPGRLVSVRRDRDKTSALVCWRAAAFGDDEAVLLRLLHAEFGWVIDAAGLFAGLAPENRVVLELLRTGLREKQIARRLDRSQHTIHSHVKRLYRRFAVSSRAELLVKLARQEAGEV